MEKTNETAMEEEGLCPSMYSFHSSPEEKNKLLFTLTQYGIETTVDRGAKKDRIREWIQASVIEEENEEEEQTEEVLGIRDNQTGPPGERIDRGPVQNSSIRRRSSVVSVRRSEGVYVPPVDPRIPLEEQRNRRMSMVSQKNATNQNGVVNDANRNNATEGNRYNVTKALPFQNMIINNIKDAQDSDQSSDSGVTIKQSISVQIPQSEMYNCSLSPILPPRTKKHVTFNGQVTNGNGHISSPLTRRHLREEDNYAHHNPISYKSSSSNSAST